MMAPWSTFFLAAGGAAAALAGLLIVAISVNVKEIIRIQGAPSRAAATLATVATSLAVALGALIPEQPLWSLGIQVVLYSGIALFLHARALRVAFASMSARGLVPSVLRIVDGPLPILPMLCGGALLLGGASTGIVFIAVGTIACILVAIENSWILLVEILR
jgi:modulator of FtsH protease